MEIKKGSVVISSAGHDKGSLMMAVGFKAKKVLVCDGRRRPYSRPKAKNPKHLTATSYILNMEEVQTDRGLRKALFRLKNDI